MVDGKGNGCSHENSSSDEAGGAITDREVWSITSSACCVSTDCLISHDFTTIDGSSGVINHMASITRRHKGRFI